MMRIAVRALRPGGFAGLVVALMAACSGSADPGPVAEEPAMEDTFTNPVYGGNFPDPAAIRVDERWYAYGTNGRAGNVPVLTSPDLVTWEEAGDALPRLGDWAMAGHTWAPDVLRAGDRFLLYYTARSAATGRQCIGVAESDVPGGPFQDGSPEPLVCQADEGGSIDAASFVDDDGSLYLLWKNDGNAIGGLTHIYAQPLAPEGTALAGEGPQILLTHGAAWHGGIIEAPQLVKRESGYFLFYSGNGYASADYAVGYALCDSPLGPCRDAPENPILQSASGAAGPGHSFLVQAPDGRDWILYHAWHPDSIGSELPGRTLWLDPVDWQEGRPIVRGPTDQPQRRP